MTVAELVFTAPVMLVGEEGRDYWLFGRDEEEWELSQWVHRD